ncbi:hypothetical protein ACTXT7_013438 [Hymenolepis weldensis]
MDGQTHWLIIINKEGGRMLQDDFRLPEVKHCLGFSKRAWEVLQETINIKYFPHIVKKENALVVSSFGPFLLTLLNTDYFSIHPRRGMGNLHRQQSSKNLILQLSSLAADKSSPDFGRAIRKLTVSSKISKIG